MAKSHRPAPARQKTPRASAVQPNHLVRALEDRLHRALVQGNIGVWALDLASQRSERSPGHDRIFGYEQHVPEWTQELFRSHVHPDDIALVDRTYMDALSKGLEFDQEFRIIRSDGELRWLRIFGGPERKGDGNVRLLTGITHDITEAKRAEREAQAGLGKLEAALESMTDAVFMTDAAGNFVHFNDAFATFLRLPSKAACAKHLSDYPTFLDVYLSDGRLACLDEWAVPRALRGEVGSAVEFRLRRKDTGDSWVGSFNYGPIRDSDGRIVGSVVVGRDLTEQRDAEHRLKTSETEYRLLAETGTDLISMFDLATQRFTYVSPSVERLLGYTAQEMSALPVDAVLGSEGQRLLAEFLHPWIEALVSGDTTDRTRTLRLLHPRKNGTAFPAEVNVTLLMGEDGRPARVRSVTRDVSERQAYEDALQASSQRYRLLAENTLDVIWLFDLASRRFSFCSPSAEAMMGYTPDEMLHMDFGDLLAPEHQGLFTDFLPSWIAAYEANGGAGNSQVREVQIRRKDGSFLPAEVSSSLLAGPDGRIHSVLGVTRDITARSEIERSLRQSEQRYRSLVETTFDWTWEVDAAGRYTFSSPKVTEILGFTPDEILGKTPFDLMPPEEACRVGMIFADLVSRREPFAALENTNRRKDGRLVVLESNGTPIVDASGEFVGYRGMDRDVTDRRRLEDQLRQAQKLEAIGQLAGGVAHDFNNILAATMMHIGLLQMNESLDAQTRQALVDLETEARRAAALTRQLLMFSRRSVMELKSVDVNEAVTNLARMLRRLIGEHIELRVERQDRLPSITADVGMLEQVVVNLVVNARDAMPRGGHVVIRTGVVTVPEGQHLGVQGRYPGRFVCLSVADTGTGMDSATLARIFEPFFTTKEAGKGTGLGLATVHGIVAQHRGWVEVSSWPGYGSTFKVFIPVGEAEAQEHTAEAQPAPMPHGGGTVLLVEDEASLRAVMTKALRSLGYQVYEAANGQHAVRLWSDYGQHIDLIVTDMVMPEGMTGLELIEHVRAMKPNLKAIICSGYSAEILKAGVPQKSDIAYLPKPFSAATFGELVRSQLERS